MEMLELESWADFQTGLVPVSFSSSSSSPQVFQFDPARIAGLENGECCFLTLIPNLGLRWEMHTYIQNTNNNNKALPEGLDLILLPGK
jgi:hypothetical protein